VQVGTAVDAPLDALLLESDRLSQCFQLILNSSVRSTKGSNFSWVAGRSTGGAGRRGGEVSFLPEHQVFVSRPARLPSGMGLFTDRLGQC